MALPQITSPPQASAEVVVNELFAALAHVLVYARAYLTTSGLTWGYYGGRWGGFSVADGTLTLAPSDTNYVVVESVEEIITRVRESRAAVIALSHLIDQRTDGGPNLRVVPRDEPKD